MKSGYLSMVPYNSKNYSYFQSADHFLEGAGIKERKEFALGFKNVKESRIPQRVRSWDFDISDRHVCPIMGSKSYIF